MAVAGGVLDLQAQGFGNTQAAPVKQGKDGGIAGKNPRLAGFAMALGRICHADGGGGVDGFGQ